MKLNPVHNCVFFYRYLSSTLLVWDVILCNEYSIILSFYYEMSNEENWHYSRICMQRNYNILCCSKIIFELLKIDVDLFSLGYLQQVQNHSCYCAQSQSWPEVWSWLWMLVSGGHYYSLLCSVMFCHDVQWIPLLIVELAFLHPTSWASWYIVM